MGNKWDGQASHFYHMVKFMTLNWSYDYWLFKFQILFVYGMLYLSSNNVDDASWNVYMDDTLWMTHRGLCIMDCYDESLWFFWSYMLRIGKVICGVFVMIIVHKVPSIRLFCLFTECLYLSSNNVWMTHHRMFIWMTHCGWRIVDCIMDCYEESCESFGLIC